jgi:beta-glucosidase
VLALAGFRNVTSFALALVLAGCGGSAEPVKSAAGVDLAHAAWFDVARSADERATLVEREMTLDEMLEFVDGRSAVPPAGIDNDDHHEALGSAGFVHGVARLGIPSLQETDGGIGVTDPIVPATNEPVRGPAGYAVSLPSGLATAATWNPDVAYAGGAMIGREARDEGFNVVLAGGVNLARDPRNGRTFEYAGEDPLLAGTMVGWQIRGIQDQHVISTVKHFAFNDQETNRHTINVEISEGAARESDLLAFETAIEIGRPGAVMCAYNQVRSSYACGNEQLLNRTLKADWQYPGWVMSDWGAVHSSLDASAGLDQESADAYDSKRYFRAGLKAAVADGRVPRARLEEMVHRILRSMFAVGLFDHKPVIRPISADADARVAEADEEQAVVLLQNRGALLPLARSIRSLAVIGEHADVGVLSGGGSSEVWPVGGPAALSASRTFPGPTLWNPSSPLRAIRAEATGARITFAGGDDPARAAADAARADAAVVFVNQWTSEQIDAPNLSLPGDQDALVAQVAAANPHTVVVLETGGPVTMPWLAKAPAVLEAWYPGSGGGPAIARLLFGDASPSGRLPITFPRGVEQLPRSELNIASVDYAREGADVGYKWFSARGLQPLFPLGYGLTYAQFRYANLRVARSGRGLQATFSVTNTGLRTAMDVAQVYLRLPPASGADAARLAGWKKLRLVPGQTQTVVVTVDPRIEATFDERAHAWRIAAGKYQVSVGANARETTLSAPIVLESQRIAAEHV